MRKRLCLFLLALLAALLAAEGLLQLGYFVTWRFLALPVPTAGEGPVLLAIGDSFTYGVGASAPAGSYPEQLGRLLREGTGRPWCVANRGWPGRSSRELLESIDRWLVESKPQVVCIGVGVNDTWQLPEELVLPPPLGAATGAAAAGTREPYVWTCRLWRLLTALRSPNPFRDHQVATPSTPEASAAAAPTGATVQALVGRWQLLDLGVPLQLDPDGRGALGDLAIRWQATASAVTLLVPPQAPLVCGWQRDGDVVELRLGSAARWQLRLLDASPAAMSGLRRDRVGEGWAAIGREDWAEAVSAFGDALQAGAVDPAAEPAIRAALLRAHVARQDETSALAELQALQRCFDTRRDTASAESLVQALMGMRREAEALLLLESVLTSDLPSPAMWAHLARLTSDRLRARSAIDRALVHAARLGWRDRAYLFREKARLYADDTDGAVFADAVVSAWLDDPSRERQRQVLAYSKLGLDAMVAPVRAACERHRLEAATTTTMLALLREAKGALPEGWQRTYQSHVVQLVERCRAAGAEPVLVGYPFRFVAQDLQERIAAAQQCLFVPMDGAFVAATASGPPRALFVADGHCSDDGYRIMANEVAKTLLARGPAAAPRGVAAAGR